MRRWSWTGCSRARNRRADGRSKRRSKNRSMAANGGMVGRRLAEGPGGPSVHGTGPSARALRVPPAEGRRRALRYTLAPVRAPVVRTLSSAHSRGLDAGDPDRILLRTLRHAVHVRVRGAARPPAQGPQGRCRAGLRNFVMSDDTSMDEAMAAARNETDREQTSQQLDAFHKTFNFCMSCRQYTCAQLLERGRGSLPVLRAAVRPRVRPRPFGNVAAGGAVTLSGSEAIGLHERNGHDGHAAPEPMAWPTSDLMREAEAAAAPPPMEIAEEPVEAEPPLAPPRRNAGGTRRGRVPRRRSRRAAASGVRAPSRRRRGSRPTCPPRTSMRSRSPRRHTSMT